MQRHRGGESNTATEGETWRGKKAWRNGTEDETERETRKESKQSQVKLITRDKQHNQKLISTRKLN